MFRSHTLFRTLTGAVAAAAIAAPAAQAAPADMHTSVAQALAQRNAQDHRSPDARDAEQNPRPVVMAVAQPSPSAPTWPVSPQPIVSQPVVADSDGGGGIEWTTIGIGAGLALFAVGAFALVGNRRGRSVARMRVGT